jgi:F-type H+-transporting ATPase subunit b
VELGAGGSEDGAPSAPEPSDLRQRSARRGAVVRKVTRGVVAALAIAGPARASGGLELIPSLPLVLMLLAGFAILVFPMNALVFRPLFRVLDERRERIEGATRRADKLESEADQVLARYRESVAQAREEAEVERRRELDAARSEHAALATDARARAEREAERARAEISKAFEDARDGLRGSAEALAREAAERVLGRSLS